MRPMKDPAPSRLAYRLNRLLLRRGMKKFLRFGLPLLLLLAVGVIWASDEVRRQDAWDRVAEVRRQVEERPEFMVHMMAVEEASPSVAADIRTLLPMDFPVSSFDLDLDGLRATVQTLDAVADASVRIRSGGVLAIEVVEREPAVIWRSGEGLVLLDAEGHRVTALAARIDRPDLPLIVGQGAGDAVPEALEVVKATGPIFVRVRGLLRVGERRWDVILDRDQRIMLPEDNPVIALEKAIALDAAQDLLERDIAAVDFRNLRRPVIRLTPAASEFLYDTELKVDE
ncbi:MAG: cell division protein FtsQ [Silicimonas sp.]|nr:cell division protein FtsQ [Silicimonas sp.]